MSYLLPHLRTGWAVDQAIINEEERVVCLRFGHDHDVTCMQMDEVLAGIAEDVKNFCAIYVVDVSEVRFFTLFDMSQQCHPVTGVHERVGCQAGLHEGSCLVRVVSFTGVFSPDFKAECVVRLCIHLPRELTNAGPGATSTFCRVDCKRCIH